MRLDPVEDNRQRVDQRCSGVIAQDIGAAEISFPVLEDRPQIDIDNIVALDVANGRVVGRKRQRIWAGPHDALVPMFLDAELLQRDRVNVLLYFSLGSDGPDKSASFDLVKESFCPFLGGGQRCTAI
jgi:hypothetical protein